MSVNSLQRSQKTDAYSRTFNEYKKFNSWYLN